MFYPKLSQNLLAIRRGCEFSWTNTISLSLSLRFNGHFQVNLG